MVHCCTLLFHTFRAGRTPTSQRVLPNAFHVLSPGPRPWRDGVPTGPGRISACDSYREPRYRTGTPLTPTATRAESHWEILIHIWTFEVFKTCSYAGFAVDPNDYLRTEDARFSPSGKRIAMTVQNRILLLEIDLTCMPLRVTRHTELHSAGLAFPHGVEFLTEDVIVVANREAWVTFFRLPAADTWGERTDIEAIHEFGSPWFGARKASRIISTGRRVRCGPGSVRVHGECLYICANNSNTVSKHPFSVRNDSIDVGEGTLLAQDGLDILDGIAISPDGLLIALADAGNNRVVILPSDGGNFTSVMRDPLLHSPHGLCFDPSGHILYVSDAGEPLVHVFESPDGRWNTEVERSSFKQRGISEEAFTKTKLSVPEEFRPLVGGLKGLDIDPSGRFLVGTCLNQPLAFFDTCADTGEFPASVSLLAAGDRI